MSNLCNSKEDLYQKLLDSGISKLQLEQEVERKMKEFDGFMTREGILFIIAKEHGINPYNDAYYKELDEMIDYDDFSINIAEVKEQMTNIILIGKIISFSKLLEFTRKDSSVGKVSSFIIADSTGSIKVILWEENAQLIESEFFKEGELVRVIGGYSKKGTDDGLEVHVGKKGRIIIAPIDVSTKLREQLAMLNEHSIFKKPKSHQFLINELMEQYSFIKKLQGDVQIEEFKEITKKSGEKTFLLKLLVSDESATVYINIWGMKAIEILKRLENGRVAIITNLMVKKNLLTQEKELLFTKKSSLQML